MKKSIVSERGQITLPKEIRDRHGLKPGVEIEFRSQGGSVILVKLVPQDPLEKWRGAANCPFATTTERYLREVRDANSG